VADGQPFYLCGWESGQDASPRFNAAERGGGGIERIVPIDLVAAIAQSAGLLADLLRQLGRDGARWDAVEADYRRRAGAMWRDGWFHDWEDARPTAPRD